MTGSWRGQEHTHLLVGQVVDFDLWWCGQSCKHLVTLWAPPTRQTNIHTQWTHHC